MATQRKPKPQPPDDPRDVSKGIWIMMSHHGNGANYTLYSLSLKKIKECFEDVHVAPSVFVGYETKADFEKLHGPMWKQIAILLCGVSLERLKDLGGVKIYDIDADQVITVDLNDGH